MRPFLRFLFSGNDLQKIVTPLELVDEVLPTAAPEAGAPAPGSLHLRFRQNNPGPVQIRPLFPGSMKFLVDPAAAGLLPTADQVELTQGASTNWQTLGRVLITAESKSILHELALYSRDSAVKLSPNKVWYGPVRISEEFLFNTLCMGLKKALVKSADGQTILPKLRNGKNNPEWAKHAVAAFLGGTYGPMLQLGADVTQDDVARFEMPYVEVLSDGNIELVVTTALARPPQDGPVADFDDPAPAISLFDDPAPAISPYEPLHRYNGLIPAREVYRQLRDRMVEERASEPLRSEVLADWPIAPRFFLIQFTRTWNQIPNCSAHFTQQTVSVEEGANSLVKQRLPAHGVLFLRQAPPAPELLHQQRESPPPPTIEVSIVDGYMKWLVGGGTSWRQPGQTDRIRINLADPTVTPHIAVRLPMSMAMLAEEYTTKSCPLCCTYLSLRRTVRALIDNRIAGGSLNFVSKKNETPTIGIIHEALKGTKAFAKLSAAAVEKGAPEKGQDAQPNDESPKLIPFLEAFFPGDAAQEPGAPANRKVLTRGKMLHDLWHTRLDLFQSNRYQWNFPNSRIGRGGPGAAVEMGLASFHVDPTKQERETDADYYIRITRETLVGLLPGAVIQYWLSSEAYEEIKARSFDLSSASSGHSPVFVSYRSDRESSGAPDGMDIIDQNGLAKRSVDESPYPPLLGGDQIWISANWIE